MLVNMLSAAEPSLAGLSVSAREVVLALKKRGEARASEIAEAAALYLPQVAQVRPNEQTGLFSDSSTVPANRDEAFLTITDVRHGE